MAVFAFFDRGNPSLNNPPVNIINPKNMHKIETACIPSIKVLAIPDNAMATPTAPTDVKPAPGMSKSQSVMNIQIKKKLSIINSFFIVNCLASIKRSRLRLRCIYSDIGNV